jgi:hypothetical protein
MDTHSHARRTVLKTGALAVALTALERVGPAQPRPVRLALDTDALALPDIQFDIGGFIAPVRTVGGIQVQFGPVFTTFLTAQLTRTPAKADQAVLASALSTIEANYAFSPSGVFPFVSYGLPYFNRLPAALVASRIPHLLTAPSRLALEEAVPSPTDVSPQNPGISKLHFHVPVRIEANDLLFTLRSDDPTVLTDILFWLAGSDSLNGADVPSPAFGGLLRFTSSRLMFQQMGLPRIVAAGAGLPFARFIQPDSPMWMGFADQQVRGAGPAAICTFAGNASARVTDARPGDYFDHGSVQHLAHDILDMGQFFDLDANGKPGPDGTFTERVQYMFRSDPPPSPGNPNDQYTNGGGPSFLENTFQGTGDAETSARGVNTPGGEHRMGHLSTLQRSSRAADGTPMHIRMDGPGFDAMDVPDHSLQPKLQFTVFVPSADFFTTMRRNQASLDLAAKYAVPAEDNGLERFITATRRQNFLVPPRRHRAFPLLELI